jgi:hypothetical protein
VLFKWQTSVPWKGRLTGVRDTLRHFTFLDAQLYYKGPDGKRRWHQVLQPGSKGVLYAPGGKLLGYRVCALYTPHGPPRWLVAQQHQPSQASGSPSTGFGAGQSAEVTRSGSLLQANAWKLIVVALVIALLVAVLALTQDRWRGSPWFHRLSEWSVRKWDRAAGMGHGPGKRRRVLSEPPTSVSSIAEADLQTGSATGQSFQPRVEGFGHNERSAPWAAVWISLHRTDNVGAPRPAL